MLRRTLAGSGRSSQAAQLSKRRRTRGQSLVEFALVMPILLFLTLIALDFGRVYLGYINLQNMSRSPPTSRRTTRPPGRDPERRDHRRPAPLQEPDPPGRGCDQLPRSRTTAPARPSMPTPSSRTATGMAYTSTLATRSGPDRLHVRGHHAGHRPASSAATCRSPRHPGSRSRHP